MTGKLSRRNFLQAGALLSGGLVIGSRAPMALAHQQRTPFASRLARRADRPITLRYVHHWTGGDAHAATMHWLVETFERLNPAVSLDVFEIPSYDDAQAEILVECQDTCPDILHAVTTSYVESGFLLDLTEWMTGNSERFIPAAQEGLLIDGKNYGWSAEYSPVIPVWNTGLLDAAGISSVPMTWDELLAAGEALKANGK